MFRQRGADRCRPFAALADQPGARGEHQKPAVGVTGVECAKPLHDRTGRNWQHISDNSAADELALVNGRQVGYVFKYPFSDSPLFAYRQRYPVGSYSNRRSRLCGRTMGAKHHNSVGVSLARD